MLTNRILRVRDVMAMTGLKRTTLYLKVRESQFPKPVQLGARAVGWREAEVRGWVDSLEPVKGGHRHA